MKPHNSGLFSLFANRRLWRGSFPWVIIALVLVNLLIFHRGQGLKERRLGNLMVSHLQFSAKPLFDLSTGNNANQYWHTIPDATSTPLVYLVGMSQMHAINDFKPGDKIISELLDEKLSPKGVRVYGFSAPNMSGEEALFLLIAAMSDPKTSPAAFIYAVCFDTFRFMDLRPGYMNLMREKPGVEPLWRSSAKDYLDKYPLAAEKMLDTLSEIKKEKDNTREDTLESRLRNFAGNWLPLVSARQELYSEFLQKIYLLRNWLFNIKNTDKRPILKYRYDLNVQFLKMLTELAQKNNIKIIFYVVPLNPLADNPYVAGQYLDFKKWLEELCCERRIPFANFENEVPHEYWGKFLGGPDFKHFKEEGHILTANAILRQFGSSILNLKAPKLKTAKLRD
jgi:hypothetical protein